MQFVYQALTWGFLLALVPLLIHLINMMRHRRVQWAAMEFLLKSYRKHRRWIWLKQFLLLLLRMAAVALIVAMAAQWITKGQWLDVFGGRTTHHYVLLDDSYSMTERIGGTTAFERALRVVSRLAGQAAGQPSRQKLTLLRYSQAASGAAGDATLAISQLADFNAEVLDSRFDLTFEQKRGSLEATELAVGPASALEVVRQLMERNPDEQRIVYLVSDFRAATWNTPAELKASLQALKDDDVDLQLVSCVETEQSNLAITELAPANETRAAGVPLFMNVTVKNFGKLPEKNVQLKIRSIYHRRADLEQGDASELAGKSDEIHIAPIPSVGPGESVTKRVQVHFPDAGEHVVQAELQGGDAVAHDNRRWSVVALPEGEPVLIVDGSPDESNAYFLQSVFRPGQRANTGVRPAVKRAGFLRDTSLDELRRYTAIYLLDVPRLDDRAIQNLEQYTRGGGGLAFFVGENVAAAPSFYNQKLYEGGEGLFPVPLAGVAFLPPDVEQDRADLVVSPHPVFDTFAGDRNPLLRRVTIEQYVRTKDDWQPDPAQPVEIAARLRNQAPLAVERRYGDGRVFAVLTSLAPPWNNWSQDPSLVVVILKLQSHLAAAQRHDPEHLVAAPLELQLDPARYRPEVKFFLPAENPSDRLEVERPAVLPRADAALSTSGLGRVTTGDGPQETAHAGIYDALVTTTSGAREARRFAVNVDSAEGDLALADPAQMAKGLEPLPFTFRQSDEFEGEVLDASGWNRSLLVMTLLIGLLLGEQALAYSASYHAPRLAAGGVR